MQYGNDRKNLELTDKRMGSGVAEDYSKIIEDTQLESFSATGLNIGGRGALLLTDKILSKNSKLSTLNLKDNDIDDNAIDAICSALRENHQIKEIRLSGNSITDVGILKLCDALKKNNFLVNLYIEENQFGEKSGTAFIELLLMNHTLANINLKDSYDANDSQIGEKEANKIEELLQKNKEIAIAVAAIKPQLVHNLICKKNNTTPSVLSLFQTTGIFVKNTYSLNSKELKVLPEDVKEKIDKLSSFTLN